jgi:hypothetical protein
MSWSSLRRGQLAAFAAAVHLLRGPEAETTVARHDWSALAAITLLDGVVGSPPSPLPPCATAWVIGLISIEHAFPE